MNPYRNAERSTLEVRHRRTRRRSRRKTFGIFLVALQAFDAFFAIGYGFWGIAIWIVASAFAIVIACGGRSRTPFTRLCALQWSRGDRFGATLLFFNVIEPRYSAKRIARNKAALEAAQVGMPKEWWFNSFAHRDDKEW